MHVLVTGHTGFKGSWLTLLLSQLGHDVSGIALDPVSDGLFSIADIAPLMRVDVRHDICDSFTVREVMNDLAPDAVIHMAAQPLVRRSYSIPRETFEVNVVGTLNVLEAVQQCDADPAVIVVTSDKVYRNDGRLDGYAETDPLGGYDPYSASKAMADLLAQSWSKSFRSNGVAIARAGNVIGGGDASEDRLVPDLLRAFASDKPAEIRNPAAVRPWQHVLDCVMGYLVLLDSVRQGMPGGEWNFGPPPSSIKTVAEVADLAVKHWGASASWVTTSNLDSLHEATLLTLDSTKARESLDWNDALGLEEAVRVTVEWEQHRRNDQDLRRVSEAQVQDFLAKFDTQMLDRITSQ
jgi:CDP-glucose 4,6-dehydratase